MSVILIESSVDLLRDHEFDIEKADQPAKAISSRVVFRFEKRFLYVKENQRKNLAIGNRLG